MFRNACGCTPIDHVNKRQDAANSGAAVSTFVNLLFQDPPSPQVLIQYIDQDNVQWGFELWDAEKGRLGGVKFQETDFDNKLTFKK